MRFLLAILKGAIVRRNKQQFNKTNNNRTAAVEDILKNGYVSHHRCNLWDVDINMHLNNASLIYVCELARWEIMGSLSLRVVQKALSSGWVFLIGSQAVRYRHEVKLLKRFKIHTSIVALDERWIWMRQKLLLENNVCAAELLCRITLKDVKNKSTVDPKYAFQTFSEKKLSDPLDWTEVKHSKQVREITEYLKWDEQAKIIMEEESIKTSA